MATTSNSSNSSSSSSQSKGSKQTNNGFLVYGNQDKDHKYDLSDLRIRPNHYVVRHYDVSELPSGAQVEDPGSNRIQIYEKDVFENLSGQKVKGKGKKAEQTSSHFENLGLNVEILHKPE